MCNYSSANDNYYLLGLQFIVYTDNNPLAYIKESNLGVAQIRWLSELVLFDFDIKYRMGKLNQAVDALSHQCKSTESSSSDFESEQYQTISYVVVNDDLTNNVNGVKLPIDIKTGNTKEHPL